MATMGSKRLEVKRGKSPDETRPFAAHGHVNVHDLGDSHVMVGRFEPGWRWSVDVAPIAKTSSCQAPHVCYILSGRMRIRMDDGTEEEVGPGDVVKIAPGHDAWTVGNETVVLVDYGGYAQYAKPQGTGTERTRETGRNAPVARR